MKSQPSHSENHSQTQSGNGTTFKSKSSDRDSSFGLPAPNFNIQTKLTLGSPNDPYEREADAVADTIMRMPAQGLPMSPENGRTPIIRRAVIQQKCATCEKRDKLQRKLGTSLQSMEGNPYLSEGNVQPSQIQRKCSSCAISRPTSTELAEEPEEKIEPIVQKKAEQEPSEPDQLPSSFANKLADTQPGGSPLPEETLSFMESRFGQDFRSVRVHADSSASELSSQIQAKAFTHNNHIYFKQGAYNTNSYDGKKLLAHELTHVIHQTGASPKMPEVQAKAEDKIGNWAHDKIQDRLRGTDEELITEAPIPGGARSGKAINIVGFADLYKADNHVVSGMQAEIKGETRHLEEEFVEYNYKNMPTPATSRAKGSKWGKLRGPYKHGPRKKKGKWDFTLNFPNTFEIGELKPLFLEDFPGTFAYHGSGFLQTGTYKNGFEEFVARAHKDLGTPVRASISGSYLDVPDKKIPSSINYKHFEAEHTKIGKGAILKKDTGQRVWIHKLENGVIVYFLLPKEYTSDEFPAGVEKQLLKLDPLLKDIRTKRPKMKNTLMGKLEKNNLQRTKGKNHSKTPTVQTKGDADNRGKQWEKSRKEWTNGKGGQPKPRKFLKEQAKGVEKRTKVDKKLNTKPKSAKAKQQIKDVKKIRFWSSYKGRILGALRFRFEKVFFKLEELFEKAKKKLAAHHKKANALRSSNGVFDGWKKVATKSIIRFSVEIFQEMLKQAFSGFINCINGITGAILGKYVKAAEEAQEELVEELKPICCEVMSFKEELEKKYKEHESTIATFTESVEKIQEWREVLDAVETAVRIGVQVVSCGTPPGLGCLWGLVAQIGIGAGLSLLSRTDYFEEEIAKPAASKLMDTIVGDSLHNFLIDILETTPLAPYIGSLSECQRRIKGKGGGKIGGNIGKLDSNSSENKKAREEWEKEYQEEILKQLKEVFEGENGKTVSKKELEELVKLLQQWKQSDELFKKYVESARNPVSGKLNIKKAVNYVNETEKVPTTEPKRDDLDHEKAIKNNKLYAKKGSINWSPLLFLKKPGIKEDSREFA